MNLNKEQYLRRLRSLIRVLPNSEQITILDFYGEMIEDKIENGETEDQAVAELGNVNALAQKILTENPNRKPRDPQKIAGIVLASFCGVFIVAAVVTIVLSLANIPVGTSDSTKNTAEQAGTAEKKTVTSPIAGFSGIDIDVEDKTVVVSTTADQAVSITYFTDNTQTYTFTTSGGVIKLINRDQSKHNFFNFSRSSDRGENTLITVSVPKGYSGGVSVNTSNGSITLNDMENLSDLVCDTSNAEIRLNHVQAASVSTNTSNAGIHLSQVTASSLRANSSNGGINLDEVTSSQLILDTSNASIKGTIRGREEDYNIHTDTSNGNRSPENRSGGTKKLVADTSNASINITFTE
jgi:hypothetical protein